VSMLIYSVKKNKCYNIRTLIKKFLVTGAEGELSVDGNRGCKEEHQANR
jgi:hypothetical protein